MDTKIKVLLAEDDENLGFVVKDNMELYGFEVDLCKDGAAAAEAFKKKAYDICVLDVMMPKLDGFSLATQIRETNKSIPIVFLTAKALKEDRIKGFKLGGDDYMTKPFSIEELILRIEAILKRSGAIKETVAETAGDETKVGAYTFLYKNLLLTIADQRINLTQREADLLKLLCDRKGELISREDLLTKVWGENDYFKGRSMDVFITRLRKYLKEDESISIVNVHGVGFRLEIKE